MLPLFFVCVFSLLVAGCGEPNQDSSKPRSGEMVFNDYCFACHQSGAAGAPKFGDEQAWQPYLSKGADEVFRLTKEGYGRMPKMGTCFDCTDTELQSAIEYLTVPSAER